MKRSGMTRGANEVRTTMQRRKFIAGLGSLTAAGAAGIGTGAFNFANVERSASIAVANDSNAFLALNDTSGYATTNSGELVLTFDNNSGAGGSGINPDSDYSFTGVFSIKNQGTQPVGVWINDNDSDDVVSWYGTATNGASDFSTEMEGPGNPYQLDVGEVVYVNVVILLQGSGATASDLPDTINVVADQSQG